MHRVLDRASCCVGYNGARASGNQVTPVAFTGIQHLFVTIATIQERSMMLRIDWKKLHSYALAGALMGAASLVVVPHGAAHAQTAASRGLPDFTELVEQVGPSVVNIRTSEKVSARTNTNGMDEDMLEFLRRFGVPMPNMLRQQSPHRPQPDE